MIDDSNQENCRAYLQVRAIVLDDLGKDLWVHEGAVEKCRMGHCYGGGGGGL